MRAPEARGCRTGSRVLRRRQLLRSGFWAGVGVLAAGGLAAAADFLNPHDIHTFGTVMTVPANKVPRPGGEPYHHQTGRFWLVNLKPGEGVSAEFVGRQLDWPHAQPVATTNRDAGLLALYERCTHMGCDVPWRQDYAFGGVTGWFLCPCHVATYTKGGLHVFGPAARSMDTFSITSVTRRGVSVDTGRLQLGAADDPQRAVPAGPFS